MWILVTKYHYLPVVVMSGGFCQMVKFKYGTGEYWG